MTGLRRDTHEGIIAGVAAGVARHFDVGPWAIRIGFFIASFFGGVGLLLYITGWLLLPADDDEMSIVEHWLGGDSRRNSWGGAILIGIAILVLVSSIDAVDGSLAFAAALFVFGVLLYRGTFDRPERPPGPAPATVEPEQVMGGPPDGGEEAMDRAAPVPGAAGEALASPPEPGVDPIGPPRPPPPPPAPRRPVPPPPAPSLPTRRRERSPLGPVTLALLLIALGGLGLAATAGGVGVSLTDYLAVGLLVVGAGLAVGAFWGRARVLILVGLLLLAGLQFARWFDVPLAGGFGNPQVAPAAVAEIADEYRLLGGELRLDLTGVGDLRSHSGTIHVDASVAFGSLRVIVPDGVTLDIAADAVAGEVRAPGMQRAGTSVELAVFEPAEGPATLELELAVGFGEVRIIQVGGGG